MRPLHPSTMISPSELPVNHRDMLGGRYRGATDDDVKFELVIHSYSRPLRGNEIAKATIDAMRRGRPGPSFARVDETEIYLLIDRQSRRDIKVENGYYHYGQIGSRSFKDVVEKIIEYYRPRPAHAP